MNIGVSIKLDIDSRVRPVAQPYRRIPIPLESKVNKKLEEMFQAGIIEKVEGTSDWVSAMVVEPKKDGDIRICIDMRLANKAIRREFHPMPIMEELLSSVDQSEYFSLLDISQAFHQAELHEESRYITTFITAKGLYRYKRLMFGICCAPEIFQKIMQGILSPCKGCKVFIDDILIHGRTKEEHDKNLAAVMDRLKQYNILLNANKCKYGVKEVDFLGFRLSKKGVDITGAKLEALEKMMPPKTVAELRSFLGYVNFMKRFIPNMSTETAPLNELLKAGKKYEWGLGQSHAFNRLKKLLCNAATLGYYNLEDDTEVITDASPVGLGALLVQKNAKGEERVISYASRSLSGVERRYAQTEKEALAIVWSVEKFHYYLYGKEFTIVTDHRPLEVIFAERSRPCLRIERWVLRLSSYRFKVVYRSGSSNVADPFSRLCQRDPEKESFDEISEMRISQITEISRPKAIKREELEAACEDDETINDVKEAMKSDEWKKELRRFELIKEELCFYNNILLRGTRIVIPAQLPQKTLQLAHVTHSGEHSMKQLLRTKVWWPGIDEMVKKFVKGCRECLMNALPNPPEPLKRRELPMAPWIDVAVDFLGPFPTGEYLLIMVDYYSRYQEVEIMTTIVAKATVRVFKKIFGRNGYPATITADNGPQFISQELRDYCEEMGIHLNTTTPYWPQQNGEVERQNRDILKFIRCCSSESEPKDWRDMVYDYVLMKNTSINETTGKSPSELFYKRQVHNRIPTLVRLFEGQDDDTRDRDREMKQKGKEIADRDRRAKPSEIKEGDHVLAKNMNKRNKLDTNFGPDSYEVMQKSGGDVIIENADTGRRYRRNVAHLKKIGEESKDADAENGCSSSSEGVELKIGLKRKRDGSWEVVEDRKH